METYSTRAITEYSERFVQGGANMHDDMLSREESQERSCFG